MQGRVGEPVPNKAKCGWIPSPCKMDLDSLHGVQGVVYDLLECLKAFLDNAGLGSIPVYFISPAAHSSLSHSNIYAEWCSPGFQ